MNSYIIDGSIYSLPNVNDLSQENKIINYKNYIKRIKILQSILQDKKKDIKLYFFREDLKILRKEKKLLTKEKLIEIMSLINEIECSHFDKILHFYTCLIENLMISGYNSSYCKNEIYSKYITITMHMEININDIKENNFISEPCIETFYTCVDEVYKTIFKRKLLFLAFLNYYIFSGDNVIRMIINSDNPIEKILISASDLKINHQILINNVLNKNYSFKNQIVEFQVFNENDMRKYSYVFKNIKETLLKAKNDFKDTLDFCDSIIEESIQEYENNIKELINNKNRDARTVNIINNHLSEYNNTLYDHLDSLDKLVKFYRKSCYLENVPINKRKPIMEKFRRKKDEKNTCYNEDELVCKRCSAFLRFCRYDCSSEKSTEKGKIDEKQFKIHLKPYSFNIEGINKEISELSMRIYFRWDLDKSDKIQIGWIGKHF